MTTELARHGRARRALGRRWLVAAASPLAVGAAVALIAGGGTYALWADEDSFLGGVTTAGDLNMSTGTATWSQITEGVTTSGLGEVSTTPLDFFSMPGDVIQISQPITTTLRGDNLNGGLEVSLADPSAAAADIAAGRISAGFHVVNADGVQVAPAPEEGDAELGSSVVVPDLVGDNDGETDDWTVVITVHVLGDYQWLTDDLDDYPDEWPLGDMVVRLVQVRSGQGYSTTAGGAQ